MLPASLVNNPHTANGVNTSELDKMPTIDFKDTLHDFGTLQQGETGAFDFEFVNNGKTPLVISDAHASCGCTVANYPKDPVAPGKTGVIKVTYNSAGKSGHQEKSIVIHTNAKRSVNYLYIKVDINAPKNGDQLPTE